MANEHAPARKGSQNRIRLGGAGPFVDVKTIAQLADWKRQGMSLGELIDAVVAYAKRTNFDPNRDAF